MTLSTILVANKLVFKIFIGELNRNELSAIKYELLQFSLMMAFGLVQFLLDSFSINVFLLLVILIVFKFYEFIVNNKMVNMQCRPIRHGSLVFALAVSSGFISYYLYKDFFINLKDSLSDESDSTTPCYLFLGVETTIVALELVCLTFKIIMYAHTRPENDLNNMIFDTATLFSTLCLRVLYALFTVFVGYRIHKSMIYPVFYTCGDFLKSYKTTKRMLLAKHVLDKKFPIVDMKKFPNVDNTCLICRDQIISGRLLSCGHMFHDECIKPWLVDQGTCPACFKEVLKTNTTYEETLENLYHMNESNN